MSARYLIFIGIVTAACGSQPHQTTLQADRAVVSMFWAGLEPGAFAVGYRTLAASALGDRERTTISGTSGLRLSVWYPAHPRSGSRMRFADYFQESLPPGGESSVMGRELARRVTPDSSTWLRAAWDSLLAEAVAARRNAESAGGAFPVLLWSVRHETVAAQFVLSEYLASHGYVVVATRRVVGEPPPPYEIANPAERPRVLSHILADLDTALSASLRLPESDGHDVGVLSWSYGGEAGSMLQRRRPEVDIVVSLSSNVLDGWVYQATDTLASNGSDRLTARYVLLMETTAPNGTVRGDPRILDDMAGSSVVIRFPELGHGNFNVLEGLIPGILDDGTAVQPWSQGGAVARLGYRAIVEHVHAELERLFRPSSAARRIEHRGISAQIKSRPGRSRLTPRQPDLGPADSSPR